MEQPVESIFGASGRRSTGRSSTLLPRSIKAVRRLLRPSGIMRALLSALLLQLCCCAAAAAPPSCSRLHNLTASTLAVQHINQHHSHGYKFRLDRVSEVRLDMVGGPPRTHMVPIMRLLRCPGGC